MAGLSAGTAALATAAASVSRGVDGGSPASPTVGVRSAADASRSDVGLDAVEGPTSADEDVEDAGGLGKQVDRVGIFAGQN